MSNRWRRNKKKRGRSEYENDNRLGVGSTLAQMKDSDSDRRPSTSTSTGDNAEKAGSDGEGQWQVVDHDRSKKRKKTSNGAESYPSISHSSHARLESFVKLSDVQNLVLYLLADGTAPSWCAVNNHANVRKVVVLMVPGLEAGMFDGKISFEETTDATKVEQNGNAASKELSHKTHVSPDDYYPTKLRSDDLPVPLQPLSESFTHRWPIKTPGDDKYAKMHSPLATMLIAPLTKSKENKNSKGPKPPAGGQKWKNERTPITEFIATTEELREEGYVLHPAHYNDTSMQADEVATRVSNKTTLADGWVETANIPNLDAGDVPETEIQQGAILRGRNVLALDCEMCITSPSGVIPQVFSLTRISIIDWDDKVILDEFVKPNEPITDYLTPYSGITPEKLEGVTTTLQDIQKKLINDILTPQTILVGHSLDSDFKALKLTHPFVVDTALLFPHPRGPPLKSSLKWLAQKYISREIQKGHGTVGHDSIEDARACLDLVKQKCEKGKAWGTSDASGESIFKRLGRQIRPKRHKSNPAGDDEYRTGAVVDWGDPARGYGALARTTIGCENDEQVIAGIKRAIHGDENYEKSVPRGGVDFVFGRLRELEAYRGWWNRSKTTDGDDLRNNTTADSSNASLASVTAKTVAAVREVWDTLPPCTAFIVYSGSGDPREFSEMQDLQRTFKQEYRVKKWDELSVRWTDVEEQKLRAACVKARLGIGFVAVK